VGSSAAASLYLPGDWGLSPEQFATINSVLGLGMLAGALLGSRVANALGRRGALVMVTAIFTVFALCSGLAPNMPVLLSCRFMLGVGIGLSTVAAPIFVGETSPTNRRGGLIAMYQISNSVGIILAYLIGYALSTTESWRLMLGLGAIPAAAVLFALLALRSDTPTWYVMKSRDSQALSTLESLGWSGADAIGEVERLKDTLLRKSSTARRGLDAIRLLFRPPYRRAFFFVVGFGALAKLTGINALVYYQPLIFEQLGLKGIAAKLLLPGIVTIFSSLATLLAIMLVDKIGRKPMLVTGLCLMLLADIVIATIFATGTDNQLLVVIGFAGFALFQFGFGMSFGALIWVYSAESLPGRLRATGASIALTSDFLINVIIAQVFLSIMTAVGGSWTFLGLGFMALLAIVFSVKLAPETKGHALDEIAGYWENGGAWPAAAGTEASARPTK